MQSEKLQQLKAAIGKIRDVEGEAVESLRRKELHQAAILMDHLAMLTHRLGFHWRLVDELISEFEALQGEKGPQGNFGVVGHQTGPSDCTERRETAKVGVL